MKDQKRRIPDLVPFGSYPQGRVTDRALLKKLNEAAGALPTKEESGEWTSYHYYHRRKNDLDYMWYRDVTLDGQKYRCVYFTKYRPYVASLNAGKTASNLTRFGFVRKRRYWYRFEPILWRLFSVKKGEVFLFSDRILDGQSFRTFGFYGRKIKRDGVVFPSNDYAQSDLRVWLNEVFFSTAFSEEEQKMILSTHVDNGVRSYLPDEEQFTDPDFKVFEHCEDTEDKIFLLSYKEVTTAFYGFDPDPEQKDPARDLKVTDYAASQGIWFYRGDDESRGSGWWWLRTPVSYSNMNVRLCEVEGDLTFYDAATCLGGIAPALRVRIL